MFSEVLLPSFPAFLTPLSSKGEISSLSLTALHLKKEVISRNGGLGVGGWVGGWKSVCGGGS